MKRCLVQFRRWNAGGYVVGTKQDGKISADNFLLIVAKDFLGAGVPILDQTIERQGEDRIIAHALDEQPELLLAVA